MKRLFTLAVLLVACAQVAWATTRTAATNSLADINTTIGLSSNGDTVIVPATPSNSVSYALASDGIATNKGIVLDFSAVTGGVSRASGSALLINVANASAVSGFRLTGLIWTDSTGNYMFSIGSSPDFNGARFRIDNSTFTGPTGTAGFFFHIYQVTGIIDHCTFNADKNAEMIHNEGYGGPDTNWTGWNVTITPGGPDALYIENCTFNDISQSGNFLGCSAIQAYYGARTVFRYSTCNFVQIDQHGTAGNTAARWWEFYHNNFVIPGSGSPNQDKYMDLRGGSGIVWFNTKSGGTNVGGGGIVLREEDSGYPVPGQIGRGKSTNVPPPYDTNQVLDPAYCWANTAATPSSGSANVVDGRDFYSTTQKVGYTPYQYPFLGSYPVSATINSAGTTLTVVWPTTMTDAGGGRNGFTWTPSGGGSTITYSSGTGTTTYVYTLSRVILASETFATGLAYAQPGSGLQVPASGTIQTLTDVGSFPQAAGSGFSFNGATVTNNSTQTAGPTATSASINAAGTTLTVNFSASATNGADLTGMAVTIGGVDYTATYAGGSPGTALTYTVAKVWQGATVTNKYTQSGTGLVATSGGAQVMTYSGLAVTNSSTQALAAPTIGSAVQTGNSTINVPWTDTSGGLASFKIYRSLTNSGFVTSVGTAAIGASLFGDTGLSASTQYFYVVSAVAPGVESAQSSSTNATTSSSGAPTTSGTQGKVTLVGKVVFQ